VGAWGLGALLALALVAVIHLWCGTWSDYTEHLKAFFSGTMKADRFGPWSALAKFGTQAPILVAGAATTVAWALLKGRGKDWVACIASISPKGWWLLACVFAFLVNPTPFPYNLMIPSVALLLWIDHHWGVEVSRLMEQETGRVLCLGVWFGVQLVPSTALAWHLLSMGNARQELLMDRAERLTAPMDPVWDGSGLVPTRPSVGFHWYVNFGNTDVFATAEGQAVFRQNPAAVVLPTYRLSYLPMGVRRFFEENYVALAPDFWVLGRRVGTGGSRWDCLKTGRYLAIPEKTGETANLTVDGRPVAAGVLELSKGGHDLLVPGEGGVVLAWIGPSETSIPSLGGPVLPGIFPIPNAF
jgi:hypothetical protein